MAKATVTTFPYASLLSRRGVSVIPAPAPREPHVLAMIVAGIRCFEIRGVLLLRPGFRPLAPARWPVASPRRRRSARRRPRHDQRLHRPGLGLGARWSAERDPSEMAAVAAVRSGVADDIALPLAA